MKFRHLLIAALLGGLVASALPAMAAQGGDAFGLGSPRQHPIQPKRHGWREHTSNASENCSTDGATVVGKGTYAVALTTHD